MSESPVIEYVEIPVRPEPVMPSACQSGGCGSAATDPRLKEAPPSFGVVRVNGVEIDPEEIAREIQHHPAPDGETAWQEAARALVLRELLLQEAERLGISAEPDEDEAGRQGTEEDALVHALLDQQLELAPVTNEECRRYYEGHLHRFRTPDLFEASHILIEPGGDDESSWQAAETEARTILSEIGNSSELFAAAAREFSKCPTSQQGGSLGQIRRGELVDSVQQALEALAEGTTGPDPVRSRFGWHLIRLQRKISGQTLPYEAVRERIADMLEARAWTLAATRYLSGLAQAAEIEGVLIDPAVVESNGNPG